jgi:threonine dehydrogenase-like Zn-dependent dehydrogenase
MKALTCHGAKKVSVETVEDPALGADDDIIVRVRARG